MSQHSPRQQPEQSFKVIFENSPVALWEENLSVLRELKRYLQERTVTNVRKYLTEHKDLVKRTILGIKITHINEAALKLCGARSKEEVIASFGKSLGSESIEVMANFLATLLEGQRYFETQFRVKNFQGKIRDVHWKIFLPEEYARNFSRAVVTLEDITGWKKMERHLRNLAQLDSLTKLYNHRTINHFLESEFLRAKRYGSSLSCMMIDVDQFKIINDKYGHPRGDQVIKRLAQTLCSSLRQVDIIGRYGGDEFFVILPETKAQNAQIAATRIQNIFADKKFQVRPNTFVTIALSIGISGFPSADVKEAKDLIARADKAMYTAKKSGRNRIVVI